MWEMPHSSQGQGRAPLASSQPLFHDPAPPSWPLAAWILQAAGKASSTDPTNPGVPSPLLLLFLPSVPRPRERHQARLLASETPLPFPFTFPKGIKPSSRQPD